MHTKKIIISSNLNSMRNKKKCKEIVKFTIKLVVISGVSVVILKLFCL